MRRAFVALALASAVRGEIIDRVAAIVGRDVITQSDAEREARLEAYFGRGRAAAKEVLERLIEQRLVFQEMELTSAPEVTDGEVKQWFAEMKGGGSHAAGNGLVEADLAEYARRQIQVEKLIDLRFRTGQQVSEEELKKYYQERVRPAMQREGVKEIPPLEAVRDKVEKAALEGKVTQAVDEWLRELRRRTRVKIVEAEEP